MLLWVLCSPLQRNSSISSRGSDGRSSADESDQRISMSSMTSDKDSKKAGNRLSMDVKNRVKSIDKVRHLALLVGSSGPPQLC